MKQDKQDVSNHDVRWLCPYTYSKIPGNEVFNVKCTNFISFSLWKENSQ